MTNPTESPADALAALRRYSRDTSRGLYAAEAVEVLKYIATLEANQKPLIEVGQFKGEIRMEGNTSSSPQELPPLQFALRFRKDGKFAGPIHSHELLRHAKALSSAEVFGECHEFSPDVSIEIVPFREHVRTSPPSREVVELEGGVCLKGLKFALHNRSGEGFWYARPGISRDLGDADLFPTVEITGGALRATIYRYRIVGIREVPGSTVVTREEVR